MSCQMGLMMKKCLVQLMEQMMISMMAHQTFFEGLPEDSDDSNRNSPARSTIDASSDGLSDNREKMSHLEEFPIAQMTGQNLASTTGIRSQCKCNEGYLLESVVEITQLDSTINAANQFNDSMLGTCIEGSCEGPPKHLDGNDEGALTCSSTELGCLNSAINSLP